MVMLLFVLFGAFLAYACCAAAGREDDWAEAYQENHGNKPF